MMFFSKTVLGIDISNRQINMALLKKDGNNVRMLKSASGPIPNGVIKNGNIEEPAVLAKAIKRLKAKNGIHTRRTAISLVANPVLMQILELPANNSTNIRQFVRNEIKQYAVLPRKKVAVDFCGIKSSGKSGGRQILVAAANSQKIADTIGAMGRCGLHVDSVEPASLAYLRACSAKKIVQKFGRNLLFAIVQENVFTLCLFRNQTLDFVRTKNMEGNILQSDEGCEWLAEEINTVLQFYELEILDKRDAWEITIVTSVAAQTVKEKLEQQLTNVKGMELNIRTWEDAYLDTPVAGADNIGKPSAVAAGLAMKLLDFPGCGLNINLLPSEITETRTVEKQMLTIANIAAVIFFLVVVSIGFVNMRLNKVNDELARKAKTKFARNDNTHELISEQAELKKQIGDVSARLEKVNDVLRPDSFLRWGEVLEEVRLVVPKTVQMTSLASADNSSMQLDGRAFSYEEVRLFADALNSQKRIKSASLAGTAADDEKNGLINYTINCLLNR
jgi:type IV pilus assembly protein PilM